ncbi:MAG: His/Gly/Thr/Pro-type tRNA ligase C-terminal domain-containing protein [Microcoleaceae cyanobacterium]
MPFRLVTGRSLKDGKLELVQRANKKSEDVPIDQVVSTIQQLIAEAIEK